MWRSCLEGVSYYVQAVFLEIISHLLRLPLWQLDSEN